MDFSKGELAVMGELWEGKCLDENGEIQALELSNILYEKYGYGKTSCYTFFSRLLEKNAIERRYPKYTIKSIISRDEALKKQREEAVENLFQGSILNVVQAFLREKPVDKEELQKMRDLIDAFELEEDEK